MVKPALDAAPEPVYPPREPPYLPAWFLNPPRFPEPPIIIPPVPTPCDPEEDPDCELPEEPEEPPTDVPEPGGLAILFTGAVIYWLFRRRQIRNAT